MSTPLPTDPQTIFDTVLTALRHQDRGAITLRDNLPTCKYRTEAENGAPLRCAIGILIPDRLYTPRMEFQGIGSLLAHPPTGALREALEDWHPIADFLVDLQYAHDTSARSCFVAQRDKGDSLLAPYVEDPDRFPIALEANMKELAERYGLQYTPPRMESP